MEFTAKIPFDLKLRKKKLKYILKTSLSDLLPPEILNRSKMGFGIPIGRWFRSELKDYIKDILLSDECLNRGYFKKDYISHMLEAHIERNINYGSRIWVLLILELWHRAFNL